MPAAGVHPVQRWRGELGAEFGGCPVIRGPLPQQEQLTSMTGPCGWHTTQCRASVTRRNGTRALRRTCAHAAHAVRTSRGCWPPCAARSTDSSDRWCFSFWVPGPGKTLAAATYEK